MKRLIAMFALVLCLGAPAGAVNPDEMLDDPALEQRAREISEGLRCLVCQNQSIDDSNAELARDLRLLVRERLEAGDSNAEAVDYIVDRYGEYVLLKPVVAPHTIVLWIAAPVIFLIGAAALLFAVRRRRETAESPDDGLSAEERATLDALRRDGETDQPES